MRSYRGWKRHAWVILFSAACITSLAFWKHAKTSGSIPDLLWQGTSVLTPTPWASIGGCGSSSGSVSSGMQLKWIGQGVSGSLFDAEAVFSQSLTPDTALDNSQAYDGRSRLKTTALFLGFFFIRKSSTSNSPCRC